MTEVDHTLGDSEYDLNRANFTDQNRAVTPKKLNSIASFGEVSRAIVMGPQFTDFPNNLHLKLEDYIQILNTEPTYKNVVSAY